MSQCKMLNSLEASSLGDYYCEQEVVLNVGQAKTTQIFSKQSRLRR